MNTDDVGKYFTRNGKDIWQMIYAAQDPTACLENLVTKERAEGVIGCRNLDSFVKLIPERETK